MTGARLLCVALLACTCACAPPAARAQAPSEDAVKAVYLFKMRHYVEWPARSTEQADGRTVIGVVGADKVAEHLLQIPAVRDNPSGDVSVRQLRIGDPIAGVDILFIGQSAWSRAAPLVARAHDQSTLVVSDADNALSSGSVINFRLVDERIRFDISLESAERSNLKLSSRLLTLALSVVRAKEK